jgi:hypothetical protein
MLNVQMPALVTMKLTFVPDATVVKPGTDDPFNKRVLRALGEITLTLMMSPEVEDTLNEPEDTTGPAVVVS